MYKDFTPDQLKIAKDLDGLTLKMIQNHFKLYEGYVKKTNEIRSKILTADKSEANPSFSLIGELKREETFTVNGTKLHEVYFGHLGGDGEPKGELVGMIEKTFGSMDVWKADLIVTGICARGWAITAFDFKDMTLHNYGSDGHDVGAVWGAIPLIVLDVYEHAYAMDYGVDRKTYIDSFFRNLDWEFANQIVHEHDLVKKQVA